MEPLASRRKGARAIRFAMPRERARRAGCRFRLPEDAAEYDQQVDAATADFFGNRWIRPERRAYVVARFLRGRCPLHYGGDAARAVRRWEVRALRSGQGDQRTRHQRRQTEPGDFLARAARMLRAGLKFARGVLFVFAVFPSMAVVAWFGAAQSNSNVASRRREFLQNLVAAALERTHHVVRYDPAYLRIPYPGGDVPADTGVCTDEIIRSYRSVGVDLQREVHEDMVQNFDLYPRRWRWLSSRPDTNIDHRPVPNLMVFFARKGESLSLSSRAEDYAPGDLV